MGVSHPLPPLAMRSSALLVALTLIFGCASGGPASQDQLDAGQAFVLGDGAELSGTIHVDRLRIEEGQTIYVVGDLVLVSEGPVWIEGDLIAKDSAELGLIDAPDIAIETNSPLTILGRVLGGDGMSYAGQDLDATAGSNGGNGSSIKMSSPDLLCAGLVRGGAGGQGGGSGDGGQGGDIEVESNTATSLRGFTREEFETLQARYPYSWVGGQGGDAGQAAPSLRYGGSGGSGGGVLHSGYVPKN